MDDILQKRLGKIQAKAAADKEKERREKEKVQQEWENAFKAIKKLKPRIANLLNLVNACNNAGVEVYKDAGRRDKWHNNFFVADGIHHGLGFNRSLNSGRKDSVKYLLIENGGWCGDTDLYVGKDGIAKGYHEKTYAQTKPRTEDMQKFLREFDNFEKEFLNFVDNL